jgi:hypothetical protein
MAALFSGLGALSQRAAAAGITRGPTADDQWSDGVGVDGGMGDEARGDVRPSVEGGRLVDA